LRSFVLRPQDAKTFLHWVPFKERTIFPLVGYVLSTGKKGNWQVEPAGRAIYICGQTTNTCR
jgi:hypothetical protein